MILPSVAVMSAFGSEVPELFDGALRRPDEEKDAEPPTESATVRSCKPFPQGGKTALKKPLRGDFNHKSNYIVNE